LIACSSAGRTPWCSETLTVYRAVGFATTPQAFKASGAAIELGLFTDDRFADVSAVFFSSLATWSKVTSLAKDRQLEVLFRAVRSGPDLQIEIDGGPEYEESVADGSHLFINPFARIPIDPEPWFEAGCCTVAPRHATSCAIGGVDARSCA
jgi:hypothetical protein